MDALKPRGQFHLTYWGGVENDGLAAAALGTKETDLWFDTEDERDAIMAKLKKLAADNRTIVAFRQNDGEAAATITVAKIIFRVGKKDYPLEYEFSVGYPVDSALFMFEEGNYSCDCNRSRFLSEKYPEIVETDNCGDTIEMVSIDVVLIPIDTGRHKDQPQ